MTDTTTISHVIVVDPIDRSIVAWFPLTEPDAADRAAALAAHTGHVVADGVWTGRQFETVA